MTTGTSTTSLHFHRRLTSFFMSSYFSIFSRPLLLFKLRCKWGTSARHEKKKSTRTKNHVKCLTKLLRSYKISIVMYFYSPLVSEVCFFLFFELPGYISVIIMIIRLIMTRIHMNL